MLGYGIRPLSGRCESLRRSGSSWMGGTSEASEAVAVREGLWAGLDRGRKQDAGPPDL